MRFVQFQLLKDVTKATRLGLQKGIGGGVVDLSDFLPAGCQSLVDALNTLGSEQLIQKAAPWYYRFIPFKYILVINRFKSENNSMNKEEMDTSQYQLLAPVTKQDKLACVGMNYKDHCEEQGAPVPVEPLFFCKFPSSIVGPNAYAIQFHSFISIDA